MFKFFLKFLFYLIVLIGAATLMYYGITDLVENPDDTKSIEFVLTVANVSIGSLILLLFLVGVICNCCGPQMGLHSSDFMQITGMVQHPLYGASWTLIMFMMWGGVTLLSIAGPVYDESSPQIIASIVIGTFFVFMSLLKICYISCTK